MTPLECIAALKSQGAFQPDMKLSYAGRLDPMAEGMVLILVGDENKRRDQYMGLDKQYIVEMILGIETDSYDVLGIPVEKSDVHLTEGEVQEALNFFRGSIDQKYPPFSSKTVQGRPLYWWARENRLDEIIIPSEKRTVHDIQFEELSSVSLEDVQQEVVWRLDRVHGNFRQSDIKTKWEELFNNRQKDARYHQYYRVRCRVVCSSGTYIRALVHEIGKKLGTGAFIISLIRTSIGEFSHCDVDLRSKVI